MALNDLRNKLPVLNDPDPGYRYGGRPVDAITGITLHYTAGSVDNTAAEIAAYQISADAAPQTGTGKPFPGIAYTILVTGDGVANLCWDLDVRTWHSAAKINNISRNLSHVGICYTGNVEPNKDQIKGLGEAISWVQGQLGRVLPVEGHRDPPYNTDCPGPAWPAWKNSVMAAANGSAAGPQPLKVGAYFRDFLKQHPDWGRPRLDEEAISGGAVLWLTPTAAHPKGGLLVYRSWLDEVQPVSWD